VHVPLREIAAHRRSLQVTAFDAQRCLDYAQYLACVANQQRHGPEPAVLRSARIRAWTFGTRERVITCVNQGQ
jgi:hypothetical protein